MHRKITNWGILESGLLFKNLQSGEATRSFLKKRLILHFGEFSNPGKWVTFQKPAKWGSHNIIFKKEVNLTFWGIFKSRKVGNFSKTRKLGKSKEDF